MGNSPSPNYRAHRPRGGLPANPSKKYGEPATVSCFEDNVRILDYMLLTSLALGGCPRVYAVHLSSVSPGKLNIYHGVGALSLDLRFAPYPHLHSDARIKIVYTDKRECPVAADAASQQGVPISPSLVTIVASNVLLIRSPWDWDLDVDKKSVNVGIRPFIGRRVSLLHDLRRNETDETACRPKWT